MSNYSERKIDRYTMDGWMDGWMDGQIDKEKIHRYRWAVLVQIGGQIYSQIDRKKDKQTSTDIYPSICLSIYLSNYLSIYLYFSLSISLSIYYRKIYVFNEGYRFQCHFRNESKLMSELNFLGPSSFSTESENQIIECANLFFTFS